MKKSKWISVCMTALAAIAFASCSDDKPDNREDNNKPDTPEVVTEKEQIPHGVINFECDLLSALSSLGQENENAVVSPMSVAMALSMMTNGADNQTRKELLETLRIPGADVANLNDVCRQMLDAHVSDQTTRFQLVNSLWIASSFKVYDSFTNRLKSIFNAETFVVDDLTSDATRNQVNQWAASSTDGMIERLLESNLRDRTLALLNTLLFKSDWMYKFSVENTEAGVFTNWDGSTSKVQMMHREADRKCPYSYYSGNGFKALFMPLAGSRYSFIVVLPDNAGSARKFAEDFSFDKFKALVNDPEMCLANVSLPKLKLSFGANMNEILAKLGIVSAFARKRADFSAMSDTKNLAIDNVRHTSILEVDEDGVKASAATLAEVSGSDITQSKIIDFVVDRPFMFMLYSNIDSSILFSGYVNKL